MKGGPYETVILGMVNQEGQDTTYQVEVTINGETTDSIDNLSLADDERWEQRVAIVPTHTGDNQKVEFLLFKKSAGRESAGDPYRSLHLRIDVEPLTGASPSPTPSPNPG